MLPKLKIALTATILSSVAIVPATVVGYVASADMAYAKSDQAGGKGKSNNTKSSGKTARSGNNEKGNSRLKVKGNSGKELASHGSGSGNRGFKGFQNDMKQAGNEVRGLFRKLTGQKPISNQKSAASGHKFKGAGPKEAKIATTVPSEGDTHPTETEYFDKASLPKKKRGNMNGALNANENAIAAMLRNGNTNGPVALMASYVYGRAITADAIEDLGPEAEDYIALNKYLIKEGFVDEGVPDLDAYLNSDREIKEIENILDDLSDFDEDLYSEVNDRTQDLTAAHSAQDDLVAYWNKGDAATKEEEQALRDLLEHRAIEVEGTGVVSDALPDLDEEELGNENDVVNNPCDAGEDSCVPEQAG